MIFPGQNSEALKKAAHLICSGELVGLPTETVYGLCADALSDQAVSKIYSLKGRPSNHPLIAHLFSKEEIKHFAIDVPDYANNLIDRLWPGPLTLILKKIDGIAMGCTANAKSIALRCPAHPVAQALLGECRDLGVWGLAAPSANRFGRVSPTTAQHVHEEFGDSLFILDGGPCEVGIESTIVDCTRGQPIVLRPGVLTIQELSLCAGQQVLSEQDFSRLLSPIEIKAAQAPSASGTLESHYAPKALVRLLSREDLLLSFSSAVTVSIKLGIWSQEKVTSKSESERISLFWRQMPEDPQVCAKALFAQLREFDTIGVEEIWVEKPQNTQEWAGINDRLQRAAYTGTEPR